MDPKNYIIDPPIEEKIYITNFSINILELILFKSVKVQALMRDNYNRIIKSPIYLLTGDDYNAWSNDDEYIVDYVKARLS